MRFARWFRTAIVAALALSPAAILCAPQPDPLASLSEGDRQCLGCHGAAGLTKTFERGETLALHVEGAAFARSAHAILGCTGCHSAIDLKKHSGAGAKFDTARAFSLAAVEACGGCHQPVAQAQAGSVHARTPGVGAICSDCHRVHEVIQASAGAPPREACLGCHAIDAHEKWLPNAKLHMEVVSCAACHAPGAKRQVDLRLYDAAANRELAGIELESPQGGQPAAPIDAAALRDLVQKVNAQSAAKVMLVGRLEANGPEVHGLLEKTKAVKDCATCHRKGADPFQKVTVSVIAPDGKRVRREAQKEVLQAPTSVDSVRGFYAMGGTRIQLLDVALGLALLGGISAPLGHLVMRKLSRRKEKDDA